MAFLEELGLGGFLCFCTDAEADQPPEVPWEIPSESIPAVARPILEEDEGEELSPPKKSVGQRFRKALFAWPKPRSKRTRHLEFANLASEPSIDVSVGEWNYRDASRYHESSRPVYDGDHLIRYDNPAHFLEGQTLDKKKSPLRRIPAYFSRRVLPNAKARTAEIFRAVAAKVGLGRLFEDPWPGARKSSLTPRSLKSAFRNSASSAASSSPSGYTDASDAYDLG